MRICVCVGVRFQFKSPGFLFVQIIPTCLRIHSVFKCTSGPGTETSIWSFVPEMGSSGPEAGLISGATVSLDFRILALSYLISGREDS